MHTPRADRLLAGSAAQLACAAAAAAGGAGRGLYGSALAAGLPAPVWPPG
jgi:hypothetical protein